MQAALVAPLRLLTLKKVQRSDTVAGTHVYICTATNHGTDVVGVNHTRVAHRMQRREASVGRSGIGVSSGPNSNPLKASSSATS